MLGAHDALRPQTLAIVAGKCQGRQVGKYQGGMRHGDSEKLSQLRFSLALEIDRRQGEAKEAVLCLEGGDENLPSPSSS